VSFFKPGKVDLDRAGIDPARVPPGQYVTDRFPVLHAGIVPTIDLENWDLKVDGLVAETKSYSLDQIKAMPSADHTMDIHCVTKWSKLDTDWHGVRVADFIDDLEIASAATHVLVGAEHGFTANLPIEDFVRPENLLAWQFGGVELELEHGWPLRLVVPHLYFWKSVKWLRSFTFLAADQPGFWERNGYHMYGDPFKEQRYWGS